MEKLVLFANPLASMSISNVSLAKHQDNGVITFVNALLLKSGIL